MNFHVLFYRPYPYSLEVDKPWGGEIFASWVDLWLALSSLTGKAIVVVPEDFRVPEGRWEVPSSVQAFFAKPDDLQRAYTWATAKEPLASGPLDGARADDPGRTIH
jgi:hypothetical protein